MKLSSFLLRTFQIGCIGFGGGNALIPVIEETLLRDSTKKERQAFDRDIIIANLTPGALPVEILSSVGRREFGTAGMFGGAVAFALPGMIVVLLLMMLFTGNQQEVINYVKIASVGISAFIICLLGEYVGRVVKKHKPGSVQRRKTILMIALVCFFVCGKNLKKIFDLDVTPVFGVSTAVILAAAFFCVFYVQTFEDRKRMAVAAVLCLIFFTGHGQAGLLQGSALVKGTEILMVILALYRAVITVRDHPKWHPVDVRSMLKDIVFWVIVILLSLLPLIIVFPSLFASAAAFIARGALSSIMSFGGGDAYLAVAEGLFVDTGMISSDGFFGNIVPVVNVTPGSILCKTLSAVGFTAGSGLGGSTLAGVLFAVAGFGCSVAMSCIAFGLVYHLYDSLIELQIFMALSRWIRPIVGGLLINVSLSLVSQVMALKDYVAVSRPGIIAFLIPMILLNVLLRKKGVPDVLLLLIDIALSVVCVKMMIAI